MSRYLDPKADVVFKKVFGEHETLLKSFLNAVLPLPKDGKIVSLTYLTPEQVPKIPTFKSTVVDVRCTDEKGRIFIVEMQMQWIDSFKQRMLFNASNAYVRQLMPGEEYELLKPVYGLGLLNCVFDHDSDEWYHHYRMVNVQKPEHTIENLQLIFIELSKFKTLSKHDKKLKILWLRFMTELDRKTKEVPKELLEIPEIKEAVRLSEEAAYTPGELISYEKYWDEVSIQRSLRSGSYKEGKAEGIVEEKIKVAKKMLAKGLDIETIFEMTDLTEEEIKKLMN